MAVKLRYIVFNDPHLSSTAPSSRRLDDYEEACFDKLRQIRDLCVDNKVHALLCTGDWFHKKNPAAVPHALVRRAMDWADTLPCRLYTIAGNHDVRFSDTSEASLAKQPFGVFTRHPNISVVSPGSHFFLSSWKDGEQPEQGDLFCNRITLTGQHFWAPEYGEDGEPSENKWQFFPMTQSSSKEFIVHLCHANVVGSTPMWKPHTLVEDVFKNTNANIVHCGHIHDDIGIFKGENMKGVEAYFTNVGSITRGALNEETLTREPQVLLVEVDLLSFMVSMQRITLEHKPNEEIYDIDAYESRKEDRTAVKEWSGKVRDELLKRTEEKEESVEEIIARTDLLDHPARELARSILSDSE